MLGTELGVTPGLRLTQGVLQALPGARAVREENPIPPGAGYTAGVQPGPHRADIDPDGRHPSIKRESTSLPPR